MHTRDDDGLLSSVQGNALICYHQLNKSFYIKLKYATRTHNHIWFFRILCGQTTRHPKEPYLSTRQILYPMTRPRVHKVYRRIRPWLADMGVLAGLRKIFPQELRTRIATKLGLSGFDISQAVGKRAYNRHRAPPMQPTHISGVRFITNRDAPIGLATNSHALRTGLQRLQLPVRYYHFQDASSSTPCPDAPSSAHQQVSIIDADFHYLLDALNASANLVHETYRIGIWHWELDRLPAHAVHLSQCLHEIWTNSHYMAGVIRAGVTCSVKRFTPLVQPPQPRPDGRQRFGLADDDVIFLFSFDALSSIARKNPFAVIQAFAQAFGDSSTRARLVIKANNLHRPDQRSAQAALASAIADVNGILIEDCLTRVDMDTLLAACDCYVSLHRAEGFGFGMAEAMLLGKPVIATAYSGNLDFMTPDTSYLVDYALVDITSAQHAHQPYMTHLYPVGHRWAEPDVQHAARLMRAVYDDRDTAHTIGGRGQAHARTVFSEASVTRTLRQNLSAIAPLNIPT